MAYAQQMDEQRTGTGPQLILVAVAVFAISMAAILVRWADASALSLSFWRTAGGALLLAPAASPTMWQAARQHWRLLAVAGTALAAHFWLWLASLELTSVAASTTLVSTVPLFVAVGGLALPSLAERSGGRVNNRTWVAISIAIVGSAIIAGGDVGLAGDQLLGDFLALAGAAAMALNLIVGARLRQELSTATYSCATFTVASFVLLIAAIVTDTSLIGFSGSTWLVIAALILGPQLLGHTLLNHLLVSLGPLPVSMMLLLEPIGAGLLAWLLLDESPPTAVWIGAPLVISAVAFQLAGQAQSRSRWAASVS